MLVVIANDLPPAVRGRMKLWFIEPRANIFVSGAKDSLAKKVVDYLHKHCPPKSGVMIFNSSNTAPGYEVYGMGDTRKGLIELSGLQLVIEKSAEIPVNNLPDAGKPL
ncbi:MAG: type I-E CRISPR-associated endoribonuclease Cas2 [Chlorobiaceae bacterium]|nr:type I-E CRISPR-associated endoribonuclease Cas2 [Chlorobiaceae bacterium]